MKIFEFSENFPIFEKFLIAILKMSTFHDFPKVANFVPGPVGRSLGPTSDLPYSLSSKRQEVEWVWRGWLDLRTGFALFENRKF